MHKYISLLKYNAKHAILSKMTDQTSFMNALFVFCVLGLR